MKVGQSALTASASQTDGTYAGSLYPGAFLRYSVTNNENIDWLDARTSHQITVSSLPDGSSVVVSDGTTTASADTAAGTATVDAGAVLFPLASVSVYSGAGGGGDLLATLTTGDYADMGGGDVFTYSAAGGIGRVIGSGVIGSRIVRSVGW